MTRALRLLATEVAAGVVPLGVLLVLWQVVHVSLPDNQFLRGPLEAIAFVADGEHTGDLADALVSTFGMLALGYVIAVLVALVLASLVTAHDALARALMPLAVVLGVVPVIVITPVVIMLVGRGPATTVTVCVMITFFACFLSIVSGMRSASRGIVDLSAVLGGSAWRTLVSVRLPSAVPGLVSASKLALPASLSGVILTEYIATGEGIGTFINLSRANYRYVDMWGGILVVVLLSVLAYSILGFLEVWLGERYVERRRRATA
jgi:ABC-type nitrate/sulfonate/bicarbonate transport system permease component